MSKIFEALEHAQRETVSDQAEENALLADDTHWEDQSIGDMLVSHGKLSSVDVNELSITSVKKEFTLARLR